MSRIIFITKCAECVFCRQWIDMPYDFDEGECAHKNHPDTSVLDDLETIPDWCPLERAPETKGASDE